MKLKEFANDDIFEVAGGRHKDPGFGNALFGRRHMRFLASKASEIDPLVRDYAVDWLVDILKRDNPAFKPRLFRDAVEKEIDYDPNVNLQQRHLYYLATRVSEIPDPEMRKFFCSWFSDILPKVVNSFRAQRWMDVCNKEDDQLSKESNDLLSNLYDKPMDDRGHDRYTFEIIRRLAQKGYVNRTKNEISLTDKGREYVKNNLL